MDALAIDLCGVKLANPIVLASGTCGYLDELGDAFDLRQVGALTGKSITLEERPGNDWPRVVDLPAGMLNAIGLANMGLARFGREIAPRIGSLPTCYIASVAGHTADDYLAVAAAFDSIPSIALVEVNLSCPNTATGRSFGDDAAALRPLVRDLRRTLRQTRMLVKLSPGAADIVGLAAAAIEEGADGLTLVNTMPAMSIDVHTRRSRLARGAGGMSGPAIHPIAVRIIHEVYRAVTRTGGKPIIGCGGVMRWSDAAEMILAGATAVGMGTALFADPRAPLKVRAGLDRWVREQGVGAVHELVGGLRV